MVSNLPMRRDTRTECYIPCTSAALHFLAVLTCPSILLCRRGCGASRAPSCAQLNECDHHTRHRVGYPPTSPGEGHDYSAISTSIFRLFRSSLDTLPPSNAAVITSCTVFPPKVTIEACRAVFCSIAWNPGVACLHMAPSPLGAPAWSPICRRPRAA